MEEVRQTDQVLSSKQGLSLKLRGKVYKCCVRPVLLYCSVTWELTAANEVRLQSVDGWMIRMKRGIKLAHRAPRTELYQSWYGHDCPRCYCKNRLSQYGFKMCLGVEIHIHEVQQFMTAGKRAKERPTKTWIYYIRGDMVKLRLSEEDIGQRTLDKLSMRTVCQP